MRAPCSDVPVNSRRAGNATATPPTNPTAIVSLSGQVRIRGAGARKNRVTAVGSTVFILVVSMISAVPIAVRL
jgi:hypothetical protein